MSLVSSTAKITSGGFFDYPIKQSLRFDGTSSYLSRTPSSASNRKTWTWSGWVKRSTLGSTQGLFARNDGSVASYLIWNSNNKLEFASASSSVEAQIVTTPVYRDVSAWFHIVIAFDSINLSIKFYVNGVQVTSLDTATYPSSSNYEGYVNTTSTHYIGNGNPGGSLGWYSNQYLANIQFIDGQALTASSFGETKSGVWIPKAYTGSYGTNGFRLAFNLSDFNTSGSAVSDPYGSATNLPDGYVADASGSGNHWQVN